METRMESGMETAMIRVLRQFPRNSRIMSAVMQAAMRASRITPCTAARTKMDWSNSGVITNCRGRLAAIIGNMPFTRETMSRVEVPPVL